jgi:aminopeptidase-like protein
VVTLIAQWIASLSRKYTYRIIFIPETIGAITYLSKHREVLKDKVLAGFNISCVGDDRAYSFVSSRYGNTLADKIAANVLHFKHPDFTRYSFLERGSDERQYCSPGVDIPLVTLCRSKFATYPEYHTSLDNLSLVTPSGLKGGYEMVKSCIEVLEHNVNYRVTCYGEPQLGKRGFYPNRGEKGAGRSVRSITNLIAYADGKNDLVDISNLIGKPVWEIWPIAEELVNAGLLEECI